MNFVNYVHNSIQHPAVNVNSICRGNYWGTSVWVLTQQINYWSHILHLSDKWAKTVIQGSVLQLFIEFKKPYDKVRREDWHNYLIEFGIPRKLVQLIKIVESGWANIGLILSKFFLLPTDAQDNFFQRSIKIYIKITIYNYRASRYNQSFLLPTDSQENCF